MSKNCFISLFSLVMFLKMKTSVLCTSAGVWSYFKVRFTKTVKRSLVFKGLCFLKTEDSRKVAVFPQLIIQKFNNQFVQRNGVYFINFEPCEAMCSSLWYLQHMGLPYSMESDSSQAKSL